MLTTFYIKNWTPINQALRLSCFELCGDVWVPQPQSEWAPQPQSERIPVDGNSYCQIRTLETNPEHIGVRNDWIRFVLMAILYPGGNQIAGAGAYAKLPIRSKKSPAWTGLSVWCMNIKYSRGGGGLTLAWKNLHSRALTLLFTIPRHISSNMVERD